MFTIGEIIKITSSGSLCKNRELKMNGVSTDSRTIKPNELFVALEGSNFDGTAFLGEAVKKGAAAAVVNKSRKVKAGIPLIKVGNTLEALALLAKANRIRFKKPVIGITGSNGKTTAKDLLSHILGKKFKVLKTENNCNNKVGVAGTLLRLNSEDIAVLEAGTSHIGEIAYNSAMLLPDAAIITNIGFSHLEGLESRAGALKEKMAMVESLDRKGVWIRNRDDDFLAREERKGVKQIGFGIESSQADFRAEKIKLSNDFTEFYLGNRPVRLSLLGIHNIYNALAAIAAASLFMDVAEICNYIKDFKGAPMRMQVVRCNNFTVINDAYNSNPTSFERAILTLKEYGCKGKKIICCADMLELGEGSEKLHYDCGGLIANTKAADMLVAFGRQASFIAKGAVDNGMPKDSIKEFSDKNEIAGFLRESLAGDDTILVKGSRSMKMEEVVEALIAK